MEAAAVARITAVVMAGIWGAIFGSFVNVIVHRLPRNESPFTGRSRCPRCHAAILARDNVPIVGWLLRRGRCRSCGARIAATYPLVEATCGLLCAALAAASAARGEVDHLVVVGAWWPLVKWAAQAIAILCIVTWALLEDRDRPGCPAAAPLVAVFVVTAAAFPAAGPPGVLPDGRPWPSHSPAWAAGIAALGGSVVGRVAGRSTGTATGRCALAVLGALVGWQAVTVVAVVMALAAVLDRRLLDPGDPPDRRRVIRTANTILTIAATTALATAKSVLLALTARPDGP